MTLLDLGSFHFLRPHWLWALLLVAAVVGLLWRRQDVVRQWQQVIAPHLLEHLVVRPSGGFRLRPPHLLLVLLVLAVLALAGPSWRQEPPPFTQDTAPLVIAMDLSSSMRVEDVQPSRFERAQQKVRDLLLQRVGARTGLLAYAGSAHRVLPLTDDPSVIDTFVAALDPSIMPRAGKDAVAALELAEAMLADEPIAGTILFLTDGIAASAVPAFVEHESGSENQVLVLAVGTERGGVIPSDTGALEAGQVATLDREGLETLTGATSAYVTGVTVDGSDLDRLTRRIANHLTVVQQQDATSRWRDEGYWLVWPLALIALAWGRKGWTIRWET